MQTTAKAEVLSLHSQPWNIPDTNITHTTLPLCLNPVLNQLPLGKSEPLLGLSADYYKEDKIVMWAPDLEELDWNTQWNTGHRTVRSSLLSQPMRTSNKKVTSERLRLMYNFLNYRTWQLQNNKLAKHTPIHFIDLSLPHSPVMLNLVLCSSLQCRVHKSPSKLFPWWIRL